MARRRRLFVALAVGAGAVALASLAYLDPFDLIRCDRGVRILGHTETCETNVRIDVRISDAGSERVGSSVVRLRHRAEWWPGGSGGRTSWGGASPVVRLDDDRAVVLAATPEGIVPRAVMAALAEDDFGNPRLALKRSIGTSVTLDNPRIGLSDAVIVEWASLETMRRAPFMAPAAGPHKLDLIDVTYTLTRERGTTDEELREVMPWLDDYRGRFLDGSETQPFINEHRPVRSRFSPGSFKRELPTDPGL